MKNLIVIQTVPRQISEEGGITQLNPWFKKSLLEAPPLRDRISVRVPTGGPEPLSLSAPNS